MQRRKRRETTHPVRVWDGPPLQGDELEYYEDEYPDVLGSKSYQGLGCGDDPVYANSE